MVCIFSEFNEVSFCLCFGSEFQIWRTTVLKLLLPYLDVLWTFTYILFGLCVKGRIHCEIFLSVSGSFHETWNNFMKYFYFSIQHSEAAVQMCSVKKVFLEISQNSQENICNRVSFLTKLQAWGQRLFFNKVEGLRPATLFKKASSTGVFLWILLDFQEHIFLQNASGGWFWTFIADVSHQ